MASMFDLNDRMLSPPSSPSLISSGGSSGSGHQHHTLGDQRALEKLALELSMLDLSELNAGNPELCQLIGIQTQSHHASNASAALAAALMSPQSQQQHSPGSGLVAGSTLNAFTSMLVAASADDRSKKSQNMTECVPVPSSEHVAEIVGRQGEFFFLFFLITYIVIITILFFIITSLLFFFYLSPGREKKIIHIYILHTIIHTHTQVHIVSLYCLLCGMSAASVKCYRVNYWLNE